MGGSPEGGKHGEGLGVVEVWLPLHRCVPRGTRQLRLKRHRRIPVIIRSEVRDPTQNGTPNRDLGPNGSQVTRRVPT